ncbi:response regulator transcription factor [Treponema primitia]|nr:response regulator transcription factor [Treponema primitia]
MKTLPNLFILEDHPIMRNGLEAYFSASGRWRVLGTSSTLNEAKAFLTPGKTTAPQPDIILLDIQLEDAWGLDLVPWMKERNRTANPPIELPRFVVYTNFTDYSHVNTTISMGVYAYVCKSRNEAELEEAINTVLRGEMYIDKSVEPKLNTIAAALSLLTKREAQILTLVKDGLSNKQIAAGLGIKVRTVENILSFVYMKTGVSSRLELQKM